MSKSTAERLLSEIQRFLDRNDMPPTVFGKLVTNDPHLVRSLRERGSMTTRRMDQCRNFMREYKPEKRNGR